MLLPAPMGGTFVSLGVRALTGGNICNAGKADTKGYFFLVHANRTFTITKGSQHVLASGALPAANFGLPMPKQMASDSLVGTPLELELEARGATITARLNSRNVATVTDGDFPRGFASLACGWHRVLYERAAVRAA